MTDPAPPLKWMTADQAVTELGLTVQQTGLDVAREQLLARCGLPLELDVPPSRSFRVAPVYQALANAQAATAVQADEYGSPSSTVRLYPFDRKIMALCIVPRPAGADADGNPTADTSHVDGLLG